MNFIELKPSELALKPFDKLDKEWALLSAGSKEALNTMTVSWGGLGTLWNKPVVTVYVRPQRHTRRFIESEDRFSLCFFDKSYKKTLSYLGSVSGKDEKKIANAKLSPVFFNNAPCFEEASLIFVCKKIYVGAIDPNGILDPSIIEKNYPLKDFHSVYIGEIEKIYSKEQV